jgi:hypothetical protein
VLFLHSPALVGARNTFFSTFLAMFHVMHFTFTRARFTNVGTCAAKQRSMSTADRHQFRRRPANRSTFAVKLDTADHHLYIFLF